MSRAPTWLLDHARDVHSQTGEDGVLEAALELLPNRQRWVVEFGAWDGQFLSNSRYLIEQHNYRGVLIEGDAKRYQDLVRAHGSSPRVLPVHRFVDFAGPNRLDEILRTAAPEVPTDFDLLSIDIDGNDYHVWEAVTAYRPKLVIIEFNPTIPTEVSFVQERAHGVAQGASVRALVELGKQKGYELISVLPWNAIFTTSQLFPLFEIEDNRVQTLRTDTSLITYLFSGYDGSIKLAGHGQMPWQGMQLKERKLQVIPRFLQRHPSAYNRLQRKLLSLLRRVG